MYLSIKAICLLLVAYGGMFVWRKEMLFDDFDNLGDSNFVVSKFSFSEAGSNMVKDAVQIKNSILSITLDKNTDPLQYKFYNGGELSTKKFFKYGEFSVRMKSNIREGTVSSFFLINKWKAKKWIHREIDIEFIGKDPTIVQFTVHLFSKHGEHVYYKHIHTLGFDASKEFHKYSIRWEKDLIAWFVDDVKVYVETRIVPDESLQIKMNHWCSNSNMKDMVDWLGLVDDRSLPSTVYYDWIRYEPIN